MDAERRRLARRQAVPLACQPLLVEAVRQFSALERRLNSGEDVSKYLAATLPSQRPPAALRPTMVVEKRGSLEGSKAGGQKAVPNAILPAS